MKKDCKQLMQILNDPMLPMRQYFDSRCSNRSGRFLLAKQIQTVVKPCFCPLLCQFLMSVIIVISPAHACVRMSAEEDDFQREGGGMCASDDFT